MLDGRVDELHGDELVAALLEAGDDLADESWLRRSRIWDDGFRWAAQGSRSGVVECGRVQGRRGGSGDEAVGQTGQEMTWRESASSRGSIVTGTNRAGHRQAWGTRKLAPAQIGRASCRERVS